MNPSAPVVMNAARQPHVSVIHGTMIGVMIAPTFDPALKIPVASARSLEGNHSATVLIDAGKLPDSPNPRAKRAALKPAVVLASAVDIADTLQITTEAANPRRVPMRSITRPAISNPNAYEIVNHETTFANCCSFQPMSRDSVGPRMPSTCRSM